MMNIKIIIITVLNGYMTKIIKVNLSPSASKEYSFSGLYSLSDFPVISSILLFLST